MTVIAYILISLFMAFWLAVCITVKINWVREDKEMKAREKKEKNPNIFSKKY